MISDKEITLLGRVKITGDIRLITGLHIGKGKGNIAIGGLDNAIMRNPATNQPYIPGTSLKGKLRSLAERREPGIEMNTRIGQGYIHTCEDKKKRIDICEVCKIFGMPGQAKANSPTRLVVRDVFLTEKSRDDLRSIDTDLPFTEIKYEASIDRVTAAATPRPVERVPAGAIFGDFEFIFSVYEQSDIDLLKKLFEYMRILEDDYLGGSGSRGYGKVKFENLILTIMPIESYAIGTKGTSLEKKADLIILQQDISSILAAIKAKIKEPSDG